MRSNSASCPSPPRSSRNSRLTRPPNRKNCARKSITKSPAPIWSRAFWGRLGHAVQPIFAPLGFDWKISVGILGAFPAREVIIATLGIIYNVGADVDEESGTLRDRMAAETHDDGSAVYTPLVAVTLMVFFALCRSVYEHARDGLARTQQLAMGRVYVRLHDGARIHLRVGGLPGRSRFWSGIVRSRQIQASLFRTAYRSLHGDHIAGFVTNRAHGLLAVRAAVVRTMNTAIARVAHNRSAARFALSGRHGPGAFGGAVLRSSARALATGHHQARGKNQLVFHPATAL